MPSNIDLSILSPAHQNERYIKDFIVSLYTDVVDPFKKKGLKYEVIIAEDGSTDKTREILVRLNKKYHFKLLSGNVKLGYVKAAKLLFKKAKGKQIFFLDSDGEINPKSFWKLYRLWLQKKPDIISAYKQKRKPFYRVIISRINNLLLRVLFGVKIKDANAGFKLYESNIGKELVKKSGRLKYNFNSEQVILATKRKYRIAETPVPHFERESVVFKPIKLGGILFSAIKELLDYRFQNE